MRKQEGENTCNHVWCNYHLNGKWQLLDNSSQTH